ncbi:hypothetical protein P9112_013977 [Eukaryota sp. TZLM1-RC]
MTEDLDLKNRLLDLQNENTVLKSQISDTRAMNLKFKSKADLTIKLSQEICNLYSELANTSPQEDLLSLSPLILLERLRAQISTLFQFKAKFEQELNEGIDKKNSVNNNKFSKLKNELSQLNSLNKEQKNEISQLTSKLNSTIQENSKLQSKLEKIQQSKEVKQLELMTRLEELTNQNEELKKENKNLKSTVNFQELRLLRIEQLESALNVEKIKRNQHVKKAESGLLDQINHLNDELKRIGNVDCELNEVQEENKLLKSKLRSYQRHVSVVREQDQTREIDKLRSIMAQKDEKIQDLQKELRVTLSISEQIIAKNSKLKHQFKQSLQKFHETEKKNTQQEEEHLVANLESKSEVITLKDQLRSANSKADNLNHQVKHLLQSSSFNSLKMERERLRREKLFKEINELRSQKQVLEETVSQRTPLSSLRPRSAPLSIRTLSSPCFESPSKLGPRTSMGTREVMTP